MYAVIKSGGKQHRVEEGEQLKLEKIEAATGDIVEFCEVLMVGSGSDVKIRSVKFNRRKHHRKETGHRQWYTEVKITAING